MDISFLLAATRRARFQDRVVLFHPLSDSFFLARYALSVHLSRYLPFEFNYRKTTTPYDHTFPSEIRRNRITYSKEYSAEAIRRRGDRLVITERE